MQRLSQFTRLLLPFLLFLLTTRVLCAEQTTVPIDHILQQKQAPGGIVFEIVSDEDDLLEYLLPDIIFAIKKIREKHPELPIAIVTHGKEQFALTSKNKKDEIKTHSLVKELVQDEVDIHVCGTHASWYGVSPEDFPKYVDVTVAGPTQINDYEEMGYELIVLTE